MSSGHQQGTLPDLEPEVSVTCTGCQAKVMTMTSMGVCRRVLKPRMDMGMFLRESSCCRQPYSGNPTVRDEKGAYGIVNQRGIKNLPHNRKGARQKLSTYSCACRISTRPH